MRAFLFVFLCFLCCQTTFAQLDPVKWSFEAEKVNEAEYNIIITADIENGWSVYSQFLDGQDGPIPTSFEFYDDKHISLIGKTNEAGIKKETYDDLFGMKLVKFSRKAKFTQRVKVAAATRSVKGQLTYMTCDESSCLPPANLDFNIALKN